MNEAMVTIDVVSDVMCPWCYIGKRRLEKAAAADPEIALDVHWRPFQLDATIPPEGMDRRIYLERKFGGAQAAERVYAPVRAAGEAEAIPFAFDRIRRSPNTINAHRLIRWAGQAGLQEEMVERLFRLYFIDGGDLTDNSVLAKAAAEHDALHARIQQIEAEIVVRAQELQRANERLRASESRFAAMFAGASLGIVILDDSGMPLETNPAFGRMTGYTADQLRQTQFASLMHAADRTIYQQQLAALRRGDSDTAVIETRFVKTGGAPAWVRLSLSAVAGTSPRQSTIVAIAEDITVAKTTEERLRRTEHLVAMAGRVARMGGWFVHLPEFEMVWSKEVCDIHEVPYGTALAVEDGIRFYASEWRDTISEAFTKCVELGVPYDLELEIITATDRRVWVRTIGEAVRDAAGTIVAVQGAFQDISRRKKSEEESRRLNERLTTVLESLSVGFFILDHEWRFTYINPEAEKMLLRTREDLVGRNIWDEFAPAIGTPFYDHYHRAVAENHPVTFEEFYPPLNIWVHVDAHPSREGLAVYFRDVTEEKRAQDRQKLLAEAGEILASSIEYETTLRSVAQLAVPTVADWCAVDLVNEDGLPQRVRIRPPRRAH